MLGILSQFTAFRALMGGSGGLAPVGIDLGTETLRLVQIRPDPHALGLASAASRDVPVGMSEDPVAYVEFVGASLREMWREGGFAGRRAVLGLPSSMTHLLHLRLAKMDGADIAHSLAFEAAGKLPFDPMAAMLRHHVVGDVYSNDGPRQEVICTAVRRDHVELLLSAAEKARLEVVGLVASPVALRDCFTRIYRRSSDAETGFCMIDIGRAQTRVTIMRCGHLYFARSVNIGGEHFNQAVAEAVGVAPLEAKLLRSQLAEQQPEAEPVAQSGRGMARPGGQSGTEHQFAMLGAAMQASAARAPAGPAAAVAAPPTRPGSRSSLVTEMSVAQAVEPVVNRLAEEIQRCRRYHEATFPGVPVDRLVFVGGEANQRLPCQAIARRLGVAAQLGDPVSVLEVDLGARDVSEALMLAGLDRRRPQPAWAVACGLSLAAGI